MKRKKTQKQFDQIVNEAVELSNAKILVTREMLDDPNFNEASLLQFLFSISPSKQDN